MMKNSRSVQKYNTFWQRMQQHRGIRNKYKCSSCDAGPFNSLHMVDVHLASKRPTKGSPPIFHCNKTCISGLCCVCLCLTEVQIPLFYIPKVPRECRTKGSELL